MKQPFLIPLINTHTHAAMVAFRGMAEDVPLQEWLEKHIWPAEASQVTADFVYHNTKKAIREMRKNGIRAFADMYFFQDEVARVAKELDMHVLIGEGLLDFPTPNAKTFDEGLQYTEQLLIKYAGDPLVTVAVAPHSIYTVSKEHLITARTLAEKYHARIHIHAAETESEFTQCQKDHGMTPIQYLDSLGILGPKTLLAHCVWITDEDIEILAARNAHVAHCPLSNLKLGSGIAPICKLLAKGVNVSLGTDGAASSNRLDVWEAGKIAALLQKGMTHDPTVLPAKQVIEMMSISGMKALGLSEINGQSIDTIKNTIATTAHFNYLYEFIVEQLPFEK